MQLSTLLTDFCLLTPNEDVEINGLSLDSRLLKSGDLFFALQGTHQDGRQFIEAAIQKGAIAIVAEADHAKVDWQNGLPIISIPNLRAKTAEIAARFYHYPAKKMRMVGVTGTSGKTSCTQFMASSLQQLSISCGVIGTLGTGLYGDIQEGTLTTPDAITLQTTFANFLIHGAKTTVMEVSSHSLDQGRVNGIEFDIGVFTNLSRDHLDYHGTMQAYGAAKKRLFSQAKFAVINADDAFGRELLSEFSTRKNVISYQIAHQDSVLACDQDSRVYADQVRIDSLGTHARINTPWGTGELHSPLVGQFNLSNLLAVLTTLCLLDIPFSDALKTLALVDPVPGRMQSVGGGFLPLVVVDYAHKPDALEKVLIALRQQCQGKLYCVFGCGGDRDRGKRPIMAKIAEQYADHVIVTDDNPRHEDATQIIADILQGFSKRANVMVQHDRSKAISDVIESAVEGDCVLIAGKGAETYQQIGDQKFPFSDLVKVNESINHRRGKC